MACDRRQLDGRFGRGGNPREPKARNLIAKGVGWLRQMSDVDAGEGIERLDLDVQFLDEQHRERPQLREVPAGNHLSHGTAVRAPDDVECVTEVGDEAGDECVPLEQGVGDLPGSPRSGPGQIGGVEEPTTALDGHATAIVVEGEVRRHGSRRVTPPELGEHGQRHGRDVDLPDLQASPLQGPQEPPEISS